MVSTFVAIVLAAASPQVPADADITLVPRRHRDLDSQELNAQVIAAMLLPYRYGVTQMPCRAREWQPQRGWHPAREPSGRIQWVLGTVAKARWSGIYGTCFIQSPAPRDAVPEVERAALECECNGWLPSR